ncbi:2-hydroxyacid dehydrogenase [Saccharospirillum salsuginis]|uniref:Lactate dehydrogenase n=1 Tax=Saccharospirillum salsuginis TaxID=418750 RepID=A0A918KJA6_9GAMM|nr:2-hydroxyacid dehydrogenase [Saccharospirillum salsuginis]GGX65333.1 lactate dehydrogenase [Saccharospirillum salsuginis]
MKVAVFSSKSYDETYLNQANNGQHQFTYFEPHLDAHTAALSQGHDAVCCFVNDTLDEATLGQLHDHGIRLVALRCAGFNNVDLGVAQKLGITVARVPDYSPYAVAEHACALILGLNRNTHRAFNRVRENDYSLHGMLGFDLHGKTVGVVGTGKIGVAFIRIMRGFGCRVICHDPYTNPQALDAGAEYVDQDTLWAESDIVSLHCPLLPATRHLINNETLKKMKDGVMLINTSRGALIETVDVINALKNGKVGYLGLDVYEEEADLFFEDNSDELLKDDTFARLLTFRNVLITGHQAFFTREALEAIAQVTISNIGHFEAGSLDRMHQVNV